MSWIKPIEFYYNRLGRMLHDQSSVPLLSSEIAGIRHWLGKVDSYHRDREHLQGCLNDSFAVNSKITEAINTLYEAIEHGEPEHRAWLKAMIENHFEEALK